MGDQSEAEGWTNRRGSPVRSIRYALTHELRRLERGGRGETAYASALRRLLRMVAGGHCEHVLPLLEQELRKPRRDDAADEPYARAIRAVLAEVERVEESARELFSYYLRRLERQGRGEEPFARAIREALRSNDAPRLSLLLQSGTIDVEDRG